jgi:hypothetical protein
MVGFRSRRRCRVNDTRSVRVYDFVARNTKGPGVHGWPPSLLARADEVIE